MQRALVVKLSSARLPEWWPPNCRGHLRAARPASPENLSEGSRNSCGSRRRSSESSIHAPATNPKASSCPRAVRLGKLLSTHSVGEISLDTPHRPVRSRVFGRWFGSAPAQLTRTENVRLYPTGSELTSSLVRLETPLGVGRTIKRMV